MAVGHRCPQSARRPLRQGVSVWAVARGRAKAGGWLHGSPSTAGVGPLGGRCLRFGVWGAPRAAPPAPPCAAPRGPKTHSGGAAWGAQESCSAPAGPRSSACGKPRRAACAGRFVVRCAERRPGPCRLMGAVSLVRCRGHISRPIACLAHDRTVVDGRVGAQGNTAPIAPFNTSAAVGRGSPPPPHPPWTPQQ